MGITNKTQWKVPEGGAPLENYVHRRSALLRYLVNDWSVAEIAEDLGKSKDSIYTDINKLQTETGTHTIWGAVVESIRRGWIKWPRGSHASSLIAPPTNGVDSVDDAKVTGSSL